MNKQEIRKNISDIKKEYGAERLKALSAAVCANLESNPVYDSASVVLLYASLPDEVDTTPLVQRAIASGKTVVLPVVLGGPRRILGAVVGAAVFTLLPELLLLL